MGWWWLIQRPSINYTMLEHKCSERENIRSPKKTHRVLFAIACLLTRAWGWEKLHTACFLCGWWVTLTWIRGDTFRHPDRPYSLKGTVQPKNQHSYLSPPTCSAIDPSTLIWCELSSFADVSHVDVGLISNFTDLNGTWLVVLKKPNRARRWSSG